MVYFLFFLVCAQSLAIIFLYRTCRDLHDEAVEMHDLNKIKERTIEAMARSLKVKEEMIENFKKNMGRGL